MDIEPEEIFKFERKVLVDIRSPQEFEEFHIPGAINVPLFDNEEKKVIGFIYRTLGEEKAKEIGKELALKKFDRLLQTFRELQEKYENVIVYCWRGGLRSQGLCKALSEFGIKVYRIKGGYRAYRQFILKDMERMLENKKLIVITGKTGVGKTRVLKKLKEEGFPVIDLEELAKDRGSVFGSVGIKERVSQKMFDSLLYEEIRNISEDFIFVEDESRKIGNIQIPDSFWKKKEEGIYIEITASLETRIKNIIEEYTSFENWEEEARRAIYKIRKYLGENKFRTVMEMFENKEYEKVVEFLIKEYYDKKYKQFGKPIKIFNADDINRCVKEIKKFYEELKARTISCSV